MIRLMQRLSGMAGATAGGMTRSGNRFSKLAQHTSDAAGSAWAFALAAGIVLLWGLTGPLFGFSESWQLVINTGTTIVTFLMVFLIQHTQGREMRALQLKLDEIVAAVDGAANVRFKT